MFDKDQPMEDNSSPAPEIVVMSDVLPISADISAALNEGISNGAVSDGTQPETSARRKRGRPRKNHSPVCLSLVGPLELTSTVSQKRGRGRPLGSGKFQKMAASSIGDFSLKSSAGKFTPHTIIIQTGEDIMPKLLSYFHSNARSICVLSAYGQISSVHIKSNASFDGILKHQGHFSLLSITGSHTFSESGSKPEIGISAMLGNPDGRVFGGVLAGPLIAAGPVHLILGTFKEGIKCKFPKKMPFGVVSMAREVDDHVLVAEEDGVVDKEVEEEEEEPVVNGLNIELEAVHEYDQPLIKEDNCNSDEVVPDHTILMQDELELQNDSKTIRICFG